MDGLRESIGRLRGESMTLYTYDIKATVRIKMTAPFTDDTGELVEMMDKELADAEILSIDSYEREKWWDEEEARERCR